MFANRLLCKEWIMAFLKVGQCLAICSVIWEYNEKAYRSDRDLKMGARGFSCIS